MGMARLQSQTSTTFQCSLLSESEESNEDSAAFRRLPDLQIIMITINYYNQRTNAPPNHRHRYHYGSLLERPSVPVKRKLMYYPQT